MSIALISDPSCELHDAGYEHPESPERVKVIQQALKDFPFTTHKEFYTAPLATIEDVKRAHDHRFVDWLISIAPKTGVIMVDADTRMNSHTLSAAMHAAGAVILAVDLVLKNEVQAAFCNVRPPGHHAEYDKAMGFCFFNNIAIGALYALEVYHLQRIAIIDFDVHHGNGTQNIFQRDKRVMYCSSFQHPFYPGYDEELDNSHILGVPLKAGTDGAQFREAVEKKWFAKLLEFKPDLIFFSAGFDAHEQDPLADLRLTKDDYVWLTSKIADIAKICCQGKMISVLEGGYNLTVLADCVPAHVQAMIINE